MDLQINQRERDGIRILDLRGRLIFGESEAKLREALTGLADAEVVRVILNLAEIRQIDEEAIDTLIICFERLRNSGGALKLLNPKLHRIDLATLMKQDAVFEIFGDEQEAVNSFFPDRAVIRYDVLEFVEELEKHPSPEPSE